mmetsp:Transcript_27194/g.42515  ORF Transcript_27194/g.42515 Transcript_27194/m.42515 type:complete len:455 (-) Transcript_27194:20-1384(-)
METGRQAELLRELRSLGCSPSTPRARSPSAPRTELELSGGGMNWSDRASWCLEAMRLRIESSEPRVLESKYPAAKMFRSKGPGVGRVLQCLQPAFQVAASSEARSTADRSLQSSSGEATRSSESNCSSATWTGRGGSTVAGTGIGSLSGWSSGLKPRLLLTGVVLACSLLPVGAQEVVDCTASSDTAALPFTETVCPTDGSAGIRYFKITAQNVGGDHLYTSLLSPGNISCTGAGSGQLCVPEPAYYAPVYQVMSGQGCKPDLNNNNWADLSTRFSKQITVCKPCSPGETYWVALKLLRTDMPCDFKFQGPKLQRQNGTAAACVVDLNPPAADIGGASTCASGILRIGNEPAEVCNSQDGYGCLFGSCNRWWWFIFWLAMGLIPAFCLAPVIYWQAKNLTKKDRWGDDDMGPVGAYSNEVIVQNDAPKEYDSDREDEIPDALPATFFVTDRYDD